MSEGDDTSSAKLPPRKRRWFRKRGIDLADLAVNSFAAFLGVLLALMVQNWTSTTQTREKIEQARTAIREEIRSNRTTVQDQVDYYAAYTAGVKQMSPVPLTRDEGCGKVSGWHGFRTPLLLRSAYDTALATGTFAQMDFAESQKIGSIYAQQAVLGELQQRMLDYYVQTWSGRDMPCDDVFSDLEGLSRRLVTTFDSYLGPSTHTGAQP